MRILRAVSRRGFSVGTAGWFTILRPNSWYPATRVQGGFKRPGIGRGGDGEKPSGQGVLTGVGGSARAARWLASEWSAEDRNRVRLASAIFGALAITTGMLWWIMHP